MVQILRHLQGILLEVCLATLAAKTITKRSVSAIDFKPKWKIDTWQQTQCFMMNDEVSDLTSRCNSKLSDLDHGTDTITVESNVCFASFEVCECASRGMQLWFCLREAYSIRWQFDGCLFLLWQVVQRSCLWSMFCDIYAGSCYPVHSLPGWAGSEFVTGAEQRKFRWPRYICLSMFCIFFWRWNPINHLCFRQLQQGRHRVSMRIIRTRKVGWHHDMLDTLMEVRSSLH